MLNKLKKLDWGIIIILILLMIISFFVVRSATVGFGERYENYDFKTLLFFALGFLVIICSVFIDYRLLMKGWIYLYILGILLLIGVYFFGTEINGAKGWFKLPGGLLFQPAEFMKALLIIVLAVFMGKRQGDRLTFLSDLLPIALITFVPFLLVMIQPDLGNAIIYVFIVLGMLWIGNVKYVHVFIGLSVVVASLVLFVSLFNTFNTEIKDYLAEQKKNSLV